MGVGMDRAGWGTVVSQRCLGGLYIYARGFRRARRPTALEGWDIFEVLVCLLEDMWSCLCTPVGGGLERHDTTTAYT